MSNKRKAGGFRRKSISRRPQNMWEPGSRELECGCMNTVTRAADGVCSDCGAADSMTMPPLPSSQQVGESTEVGWSCPNCPSGEVVGRGIVTQVFTND